MRLPFQLLSSIVLLCCLGVAATQAQPVAETASSLTGPLGDNSADPLGRVVFNAPPPPEFGEPGRRSDGGSRGCQGATSAVPPGATVTPEATSLTALVPLSQTSNASIVFGKTVAASPTFWFYVPYHPPAAGTFVLQDQDSRLIYETKISLPEQPSIVSVSLPATAPELEIGKRYHWYFKIYCSDTPPPDAFVDGWIERAALPPTLQQKLASATPQERVALYAESGIWFDALTVAADLQQSTPNQTHWNTLLESASLNWLASEPIASTP